MSADFEYPRLQPAGAHSRLELALLRRLGPRLDASPAGAQAAALAAAAWLRIRDRRGALIALEANPAQQAYARRRTARNIVLKARQMGVTTWVAGEFFLRTITQPGTLSVQVAHDQQSAEEMFRIVRRFLEHLPAGARRGALLTSRANVRQLVFPALDSEYRVETAADPHAGRGLTIRNLHCAEVARWPGDPAQTLASLRAAVPPEGNIVLESTANGAGGLFYDEWQRAPETGLTRHFFPWWLEPSYVRPGAQVESLSGEERELMAAHGLSPAQIAYRREIRAHFRGLAPQEFAEDDAACFLASAECVFDLGLVEQRLRLCGPAAQTRDGGRLLVWYPPVRGREYILAADPAGGGPEGDYACAQVIERSSGLQCAELQAHAAPAALATRLAALAREYNQALVAVERNNHGHGVLAHLAASEQYENVYAQGGQPGWLTTAASRPRMIENFAAVLSAEPHLFNSPRLLAECRTFVRRWDGAPAAAPGAHDDCVLAMAIALAVRAEGKRPAPAARLELGTL